MLCRIQDSFTCGGAPAQQQLMKQCILELGAFAVHGLNMLPGFGVSVLVLVKHSPLIQCICTVALCRQSCNRRHFERLGWLCGHDRQWLLQQPNGVVSTQQLRCWVLPGRLARSVCMHGVAVHCCSCRISVSLCVGVHECGPGSGGMVWLGIAHAE